ncbi:hypothetical protein GCM10011348_22750 [Marinobacterium nitratireducens]|uniref:Uncharacterized protein n=1 Tax=Marinobacterium nitratireducens TaxID=518897 RepID=A0A917ZHI0_9GAMM|nr:hypothetical protein [Marinobacterium nitratireducens]GGO82119.1 hypothetical protein GCM10011348_22750 [Marinobacterium nitratireducens]
MQLKETTRKIAVLDIDGESFEVDGHYRGKESRARWYTVTRSRDGSVTGDHLSKFPTCAKIRSLLH